ncbi:MAG: hypothetical protein JW778_02625 [Candidatus Altiarchaeota archaeon]|nr:hypothetical protein [Candidatus Altiarchaeota archaeon]
MNTLLMSHNHQVNKYATMTDEGLEEEAKFHRAKLEIIEGIRRARKNRTWDKRLSHRKHPHPLTQ